MLRLHHGAAWSCSLEVQLLGHKVRSLTAVALGAALVTTVFQTLPASADTVLASPLHVNFQTETAVTPGGYLADYGQAYDASRGYGWVAQSDGTPLSLVGNGRERNVIVDKRMDTFMMPQSLPSSGIPTVGAWKANIANGTYNVTIGVGDPSYIDSVDVVNVEGTQIVNFTPTTSIPQTTASAKVTVTDGVLNMDEVGGTNTKIDYIDVVPVAAPAPTPVVTPTTAHYQFGTKKTKLADGYTLDDGAAFNGTYGWETESTGAPADYTKNAFYRGNLASNKLLNGFVQAQLSSGNGNHVTGKWEAAVANGTYKVTIGVGDPVYTNSTEWWSIEGTRMPIFTPWIFNAQESVTETVTVSDGRLTLDPIYGVNSKIDYVDIAPVGGSSSPVNTPSAPSLTVTSPDDVLGLGSRLVFSTVYNEPRTGLSVTLGNKSITTLNVTGLTVTAPFQLCAGQATSFSIAYGTTASVCVEYRPTVDAASLGTQVDQGTLVISSNDQTAPNYVVSLGAVNSENYGSYHEPTLQQIVDAIGYTDNVGVSNEPQQNSISASNSAIGDEVLAPYFKALNSSNPVQLVPLAQYQAQSAADSEGFGWYGYGSTAQHLLYSFQGGADGTNDGYGQNQLLMPAEKNCASCTGSQSFTPNGSFGFVDPFPGYTSYTDDSLNQGDWHNVRVYPAKDANGKVISGEYILGVEIKAPVDNSAKNWDYQDAVFLLTNATPDYTKKPYSAGFDAKTLSSFNGSQGGIDGTGFTSVQGAQNAKSISLSGGNLNVKAANDSNTSHTNALQMGVNAGDAFTIKSTLVGPFTSINTGNEQQGIFFGPDASHYIKAIVDYEGSARHVTVWEQNGSTGQSLATVVLPNVDGTNNAKSITLQISIDPSPQQSQFYNGDPRVTVSFATDGNSNFTTVGSTFNIPGSWITASTPAGIMTSSSGGTQFTATYADFSVSRDY
jgi:regulation of enolase protein 1 (concanavalin A-like superfamily)